MKGITHWLAMAVLAFSLGSLSAHAVEPAKQETINLNTATVEQLEALQGIGQAKAQAILAYRKEHGKFKDINELTEVKGVGESILKSNRQLLTLE